jgi:hypothetical protein
MRQHGVGGKASSQITPDDPRQQSAQVLEIVAAHSEELAIFGKKHFASANFDNTVGQG